MQYFFTIIPLKNNNSATPCYNNLAKQRNTKYHDKTVLQHTLKNHIITYLLRYVDRIACITVITLTVIATLYNCYYGESPLHGGRNNKASTDGL